MDGRYIFIFLGLSILSSMNCKNSAIGMIERTGTNTKYYLKWYISPAKWVRRLFKVKQHLIPQYLYFELILSLFFAGLGPINLMICVLVDCAPDIVGILVMFHCCLGLFNLIFCVIMSSLLKKR